MKVPKLTDDSIRRGIFGEKAIFNGKDSPLIADVVVGVMYHPEKTRFVVMPVAFAEALCRFHCDYRASVPTKFRTDRRKRGNSFPIYLCFTADRRTHTAHHERIKRNLLKFEEAWDILSEPLTKLHDFNKWRLLK